MSKLTITISRGKDELIQLCYEYTDGKITYNFSHENCPHYKENFPRLLSALKENGKFCIHLDEYYGYTGISTSNGNTYFFISRDSSYGKSNMCVDFSNELILDAYEKIIPEIMQPMVVTERTIDPIVGFPRILDSLANLEPRDPKQYFSNLANNDVTKYNELLDFSKRFIKGTLSHYTQIYGCGNNGKTTFINLLKSLADTNNIKTCSIMTKKNKLHLSISEMSGYNYAIIDNSVISNYLEEIIENLAIKTGTKFILIANESPTLDKPY